MMTEKTMELIKQIDELMSTTMGELLNTDHITHMDVEEFTIVKSALKTFEASKELAICQAEIIDKQNAKLDKLLEQNAELVRLIQLKV